MNQENQNIEYKLTWRDEYLKWICGFANAQGGMLYIGIDDDGKVVGVENAKRLAEDIPNKIATNLGIVCDVNILSKENLFYLEIIVEQSNIPISYHGVYHYRSGSTKQELKGIALQQFLLKKLGKQWDDAICEQATIEDIDNEAIAYFIDKGIKSSRIDKDEKDSSATDILMQRHSSKPRNKNIANAFFKAGFIEAWGRGFKKIFEGFKKAGIPIPEISNHCEGTNIVIQRPVQELTDVDKNVGKAVGKDILSQITDRQQIIIGLLSLFPTLTAQDLSVKMSVNKRTIERDIAILQNIGIIIREGGRKNGAWKIKLQTKS